MYVLIGLKSSSGITQNYVFYGFYTDIHFCNTSISKLLLSAIVNEDLLRRTIFTNYDGLS